MANAGSLDLLCVHVRTEWLVHGGDRPDGTRTPHRRGRAVAAKAEIERHISDAKRDNDVWSPAERRLHENMPP